MLKKLAFLCLVCGLVFGNDLGVRLGKTTQKETAGLTDSKGGEFYFNWNKAEDSSFAAKLLVFYNKHDKDLVYISANDYYESQMSAFGINGLFGWQFGYNDNSWGAVRIYPLGIGADVFVFDEKDTYSSYYGTYTYEDNYVDVLVSYKAMIEYQKNHIFDTGLYGIASVGFKKGFYYSDSVDKLKPKGYEASAEIGYQILKGLALGVRVGIEKSKYDGFDFANSKTYQAVIGYRF